MKIKIVVVFMAMFSLTGCLKDHKEVSQRSFTNAKSGMIYFKDERTGICYSYIHIGYSPSHSAVPCDKIPPELLMNLMK